MENEHGKEADGTAIDSSRQALLFQCVQGVSQMPTIPISGWQDEDKALPPAPTQQPLSLHAGWRAAAARGSPSLQGKVPAWCWCCRNPVSTSGFCQDPVPGRTVVATGDASEGNSSKSRWKQGWGPPCWTRVGCLHQCAEMGIGQGGMVLYGFTELVYSTDVREGRKTSLGLMLSKKMFWFVRLSERMVVSDVQFLHCFKECFAIKYKGRKIIYNYKTLSK